MSFPASMPADAASVTPMARLHALVADDMARVEDVIADRMQSPVGRIPDVATHLIDAGGKRLRPLVTIASAALCGYRGDHHVKLAATVEFIHTATLLHDDVVDSSTLRRGRASANVAFGNASSVLVGDFLFARSFNLMVEAGSLEVLDILARASSVIAEGEVRQLAAANDIDTDVALYMEIIEAKTAALFSAAAEVAGVIADADGVQRQALARYGRELGLAFQLVDDALDYGGLESRLGKRVGDDFREGKITLPVALALEGASSTEREFWARTVGGEQADGDFHHALTLLTKHAALERTLQRARGHAEAARDALTAFHAGAIRDAMADVVDFVVDRAH